MSFNNLDHFTDKSLWIIIKILVIKVVLEDSSLTIDMNNPTCGDRIHLTMKVEDGIVADAKFEGEGCSISMSSASMMTEAIKGKILKQH